MYTAQGIVQLVDVKAGDTHTHTALPVLCPFTLIPLAVYTTSLFALSHFWFNILWLAAFYYANLLFLMRISFLIYAHFFRNATRL